MRYAIGQLSVGQILDQSLSLFKNRFPLFMGIGGIVYAPVLLVQSILTLVLVNQPADGATPEEVMSAAMETMWVAMGITMVFVGILLIVAGPLLYAAVTYAVSKEYLGQRATIKESIGNAFSKLWPVIYTGFISGIFIMFGFLLFIIPGIYLTFKYYLAQQVVVLEDKRGFAAMERSGQLMKGSYGIAFVLGFLVWIISFMMGVVGGVVPIPYVTEIITVIVQTALVTIWTIAAVVLYFHCRARNENYDLQLLAEQVAAEDDMPHSQVPPPLPAAE